QVASALGQALPDHPGERPGAGTKLDHARSVLEREPVHHASGEDAGAGGDRPHRPRAPEEAAEEEELLGGRTCAISLPVHGHSPLSPTTPMAAKPTILDTTSGGHKGNPQASTLSQDTLPS